MLRIGFAGTGLIAWAHGLGLQALIQAGLIDAEITVAHDLHEKRLQRFAAASGAQSVGSVPELLDRCDAVWVCTPTAAHAGVVDEALARGRAIFCEKPLATDLVGARALVDAVDAAGVPAQSGLVLRSAPVFRALRDLVRSGELGRPMAAVFRDDQYFPIQGTYGSKWHSIHDVDILRFCFGEVADVACRTSNFSGHRGIEDMAAVMLAFDAGFTAQLTSVWHNILSRGSTRRIELFCEQGMVWFDDEFRGPLHVQTSDGLEVRPCPSPPWVDDLPLAHDEVGLAVRAYVDADRSFVDAVAAGTVPEPGLGEALVAHRLVDAAYRSAASAGAPVRPD
jgi:myo-inositol 2-dehydrogenase/D-chiro-inositol 1-dehydrogenase